MAKRKVIGRGLRAGAGCVRRRIVGVIDAEVARCHRRKIQSGVKPKRRGPRVEQIWIGRAGKIDVVIAKVKGHAQGCVLADLRLDIRARGCHRSIVGDQHDSRRRVDVKYRCYVAATIVCAGVDTGVGRVTGVARDKIGIRDRDTAAGACLNSVRQLCASQEFECLVAIFGLDRKAQLFGQGRCGDRRGCQSGVGIDVQIGRQADRPGDRACRCLRMRLADAQSDGHNS